MALRFFFCCLCICLLNCAESQTEYQTLKPSDLKVHGLLPDALKESSGMMITDSGNLLGHNDSGYGPVLYEYTMSGAMVRTMSIDCSSTDWEDMTSDDKYMYISDTGNNKGKRKNLAIHRVKRQNAGKENLALKAKSSSVKYQGQTDFSKRKKHNFDCEGIVCIGDSLYLFTKNRENYITDLYGFPKEPGDYTLSSDRSFNTRGLVTGADYQNGYLVLVGYKKKKGKWRPFIWTFWDFDGTDFFSGEANRVNLPFNLQTETIVLTENDSVLVTNEEEEKGDIGKIYEINLSVLKGQ